MPNGPTLDVYDDDDDDDNELQGQYHFQRLMKREIGTDYIHSFISIQPLGRFRRNQDPVRRPVWLWHAASWVSS
jgi:hypothetical protein